MDKLKVSVIVPVYNLGNYVAQCINSLLEQQTEFLFEIVAVDDASQDNSNKILLELEKQYPRKLRVFRNEHNLGLAKTMKKLLSLAEGSYIAYMDGDDLALPGKLQQQADYLDINPDCTIVYHESDVFESESGKTLWTYTKDYYNRQYIPQKATLNDVIKYGCFMQASTVMVRRHSHMFESIDEYNQILLDHPWHVLNLIYGNGTIDFMDKILGRYRIHKDSFGAQTLRSTERRKQVLDDQLHVCDLAENAGVSKQVILAGKRHYYYATALYFLKIKHYDLFDYYLKQSTDLTWFFDKKHKDIWNRRSDYQALIDDYFR